MSRTAIVAISRRGAALAQLLSSSLNGEKTLYLEQKLRDDSGSSVSFALPLRPVIHRIFDEYEALVLFMPVGAAVRLLAPCLRDKHNDPAVVCVDDAGRFAVSLVSGHIGGADRMAEEVAEILGATPVITSASHVTGTLAVDLLGREFGWQIEADPVAVTRASAGVVNGEPVGVFQEAGETNWWPAERPLPDNITMYPSLGELADSPCVAALVVTDRLAPSKKSEGTYQQILHDKNVVLYRPGSLVAGMGCRRGVPAEELEELLATTFERHNLSSLSLGCIATAELKKDEPGILALADKYGVPLVCYDKDELNRMFNPLPAEQNASGSGLPARTTRPGRDSGRPTPSPRAYSLLGIWGVAEPAALLASGSNQLLVPRQNTSKATIAIARKPFSVYR